MQSNEPVTRPAVLLLDVYETLLDMSDVERKVNGLLDSRRGYTIWFELFMQYCFVDNCTSRFNNFSSIAKATMQMAGRLLGKEISEDSSSSILEYLKYMPVHEGVPEGLSQLRDQGFRLAALTNSPAHTVSERMERSGLISYFEEVLSAESIKKYKPCIEVYQWAAQKLEVQPAEVLFVSAHGWDIAGAANAGMQTAFLQRPRQMMYPLAPAPGIVCKSISDLALQLEGIDSTGTQ